MGRQNGPSVLVSFSLISNPSVKTAGYCRIATGLSLISCKNVSQFLFGVFERSLTTFRKVLSGAVDVKIQHRHRRLIRLGFAPFAALSRSFQRERDFFGTARPKYFRLQIQYVALFGDFGRPTLALTRFFSAHRSK